MRTSPAAFPDTVIRLRYVLPVLAMLAIQVVLYIWMAPRGFEFTDEAYYLHNFLHWRDFTGTVTFFGAYFDWLFRLSGASIASMRVLSLLAVLASAAILMRQVMQFCWAGQFRVHGAGQQLRIMAGPMAAAMLYFAFLSTLRAPSYNLLCFAAMAVMTACMLSVIQRRREDRPVAVAAFLYGLALGACFLSKATTAAVLTLMHLAFFVAVNRDWAWKWLVLVVLLVSAGFALNVLVLSLALPNWIDMLREGVTVMRLRSGAAYSPWIVLNGVRWELQKQLPIVAPWLLGMALLMFLVRKRIAVASSTTLSLLVVMLVATILFSHIYDFRRSETWLIVTAFVTLALWAIERLARRGQQAAYHQREELALMALLVLTPLAFSWGTNMPVLIHSSIASMFAFVAVFQRLYRLAADRMITGLALAAALVMLAAPALATQWLAWTDIRYTYRQAAPMGLQDTPAVLATGKSVVHVDAKTARSLLDMQKMARAAGMPAGQEVLDLTGDGPGVIYAIGAYPLGSPWLLGGFPGSSAALERVVQTLDSERLRAAWLLVSDDNPRRVAEWRDIMARRIGPETHQLAGSTAILNPHAEWEGEPGAVNLQLWKPGVRAERTIATGLPDHPGDPGTHASDN